MLDKHKLLQILLNLISNAQLALNTTPPGERRLTVKINRPTEDRVRGRDLSHPHTGFLHTTLGK